MTNEDQPTQPNGGTPQNSPDSGRSKLEELQDRYDQWLTTLPSRHPDRTPDCPNLPSFFSQESWTQDQKEHADNCVYCKKTIRMVEYLANQED